MPSEKCISKLFKTSPDNYLFYTKCDSLFKDVNIWMYGHTHVGQQQKIDKALVLSNPKDYQRREVVIKIINLTKNMS